MSNNSLSCKIDLTGELSNLEFQVKIYRSDQLSGGPERKATFDKLDDALEWIGRVMPEEATKLLEANSDEDQLPNLPFVLSKGPDGVDHPVYFIQDQGDLKLALKLRERYFKESKKP